MKSFAVVAACLAFSVANAVECDMDALAALATDPNVATCVADTGVDITSLATSDPTGDQLVALCSSDACVALMEAVLASGLADCTMPSSARKLQTATSVADMCSSFTTGLSSGSGAMEDMTTGSMDGETMSSSSMDTDVGDADTDADAGTDDTDADASTDADTADGSASTTPEPTPNAATSVATAVGAAVSVALTAAGALL